MSELFTLAVDAIREMIAEEASAAPGWIYRASNALDCDRRVYQDHISPVASSPNSWFGFQSNHAGEDMHRKVLARMGYESYFPGGAQRGAHDAPDYVWTWDDSGAFDVQNSTAVVHVDGLAKVVGGKLRELLVKSGIDPDLTVLQEHKRLGGGSFYYAIKDGPKDAYLTQMAIQTKAMDDSGVRVGHIVHMFSNTDGKFEVRDIMDRDGVTIIEVPPESFQDCFGMMFFSRRGIDKIQQTYLPAAIEHFRTRRRAILENKRPAMPDEIMGMERTASHWMCREYCAHRARCYSPTELAEAAETAAKIKKFAKRKKA